jgi:hypothetical protein
VAETVEAGGVRIKFEGTSDQLLAEIKKLSGSITDVGNKAQAAGAAVVAGTSKIGQSFAAITGRMAAVSQAIQQVSGVLGGLETTEGEVADGLAKIGQAVASGSPINVGIALLGVGVTHLAKEWKNAKEAAATSLAAMLEGGREVQSSIGALMTSVAGLTGDQVKAQNEINFQLLRQGDLMGRLADFDRERLERFRGYAEAGRDIGEQLQREIAAYDALNTELDSVTSSLNSAQADLEEISRLQKQIKDDAEAEARARAAISKAIDLEYASLIRRMDASKAAAEIDAELGAPDAPSETPITDVLKQPFKGLGQVVTSLDATSRNFNDTVDDSTAVMAGMNDEWADYRNALKEEMRVRADLAGSLTQAAVSGGLGQAVGSLGGSAVGAAVDIGLTGGGDGMIGAAIGGVLGGMLGNLVDSLEPVMEIVQILLDAAGGLVESLMPVFEPLVLVAKVLARIIVEGLGDAILNLAEPVGMFLQVIAEVLMLLEPFITLLLNFVVNTLLLTGLFEILTPLFEQMALGLIYAIEATYEFYNGIVGAVNAIIELIRQIPGMDEYGEKLKKRELPELGESGVYDFSGDDIMRNTDALGENTDALHTVGEQLTNMPKMWKVSLARYQSITAIQSEAPGLSGAGTSGTGGGRRTTVIQIGGKTVAAVVESAERFRNVKQRGVGGGSGGAPPRGDD